MSERRRNYRYNRILIESERILDSEFAGAVVFLSGAQIEMLRNVTAYLCRLDTYVAESHLGYYITPTAADYDDILAIVADLEETLMGNENVIFGYNDVLVGLHEETSDTNGSFTVEGDTVPAGEIWVVKGLTVLRSSQAPSTVRARADIDTVAIRLGAPKIANNWQPYPVHCDIILKEDDYIDALFENSVVGEQCRLNLWGYRMQVPA